MVVIKVLSHRGTWKIHTVPGTQKALQNSWLKWQEEQWSSTSFVTLASQGSLHSNVERQGGQERFGKSVLPTNSNCSLILIYCNLLYFHLLVLECLRSRGSRTVFGSICSSLPKKKWNLSIFIQQIGGKLKLEPKWSWLHFIFTFGN